jgi:hypothetical protein
MSACGLLDGVHRQAADRVDAQAVELAVPELPGERAHLRDDAHDAASLASTGWAGCTGWTDAGWRF